MAVLLRPGKTPSGVEVRTMLKHLTRRIRRHWPRTRLTFRGDSHYGRTEAMAWCEDNGVDYIFGLAGNAVLHALALAGEIGEEVRARHAEAGGDKVRGFADSATPPARGTARAAWSPGLRPPRAASTRATSSLRSRAGRAISTKGSIVAADRRKI